MKLVVNGADVEVDDRHAKTPLLWVLRDALGMHGTKFGCGAGFCAACTVLIDGKNMKSCQINAGKVPPSTAPPSKSVAIGTKLLG